LNSNRYLSSDQEQISKKKKHKKLTKQLLNLVVVTRPQISTNKALEGASQAIYISPHTLFDYTSEFYYTTSLLQLTKKKPEETLFQKSEQLLQPASHHLYKL